MQFWSSIVGFQIHMLNFELKGMIQIVIARSWSSFAREIRPFTGILAKMYAMIQSVGIFFRLNQFHSKQYGSGRALPLHCFDRRQDLVYDLEMRLLEQPICHFHPLRNRWLIEDRGWKAAMIDDETEIYFDATAKRFLSKIESIIIVFFFFISRTCFSRSCSW